MMQTVQTELLIDSLDTMHGGKYAKLLLEQGLISHADLEKAVNDQNYSNDIILSSRLIDLELLDRESHHKVLRKIGRHLLFGELMCELGRINLAQLKRALAEIEFHPDKRMGEILLALGFINESQLVQTAFLFVFRITVTVLLNTPFMPS